MVSLPCTTDCLIMYNYITLFILRGQHHKRTWEYLPKKLITYLEFIVFYTPHHNLLPTTLPMASMTMSQTSSSTTSMAQTSNHHLSPDEVILKYPKLVNLIGRLAVKLGRESFFSPQLMLECIVFGHNNKPPLPKDAVEQLKKKDALPLPNLFILSCRV